MIFFIMQICQNLAWWRWSKRRTGICEKKSSFSSHCFHITWNNNNNYNNNINNNNNLNNNNNGNNSEIDGFWKTSMNCYNILCDNSLYKMTSETFPNGNTTERMRIYMAWIPNAHSQKNFTLVAAILPFSEERDT